MSAAGMAVLTGMDAVATQDLDAYMVLFVKLLGSINRTDALQWSLVMLGDIVVGERIAATSVELCVLKRYGSCSPGKDEPQAKQVLVAGPWDALLR